MSTNNSNSDLIILSIMGGKNGGLVYSNAEKLVGDINNINLFASKEVFDFATTIKDGQMPTNVAIRRNLKTKGIYTFPLVFNVNIGNQKKPVILEKEFTFIAKNCEYRL